VNAEKTIHGASPECRTKSNIKVANMSFTDEAMIKYLGMTQIKIAVIKKLRGN
jgi:hypothetical protein